jgi:hypothetical protein
VGLGICKGRMPGTMDLKGLVRRERRVQLSSYRSQTLPPVLYKQRILAREHATHARPYGAGVTVTSSVGSACASMLALEKLEKGLVGVTPYPSKSCALTFSKELRVLLSLRHLVLSIGSCEGGLARTWRRDSGMIPKLTQPAEAYRTKYSVPILDPPGVGSALDSWGPSCLLPDQLAEVRV